MFKLTTDSACDIPAAILAEWDISYIPLTLKFEADADIIADDAIDPAVFYARMRAGEVAKTQAANIEDHIALFEPLLAQGYDILHMAFSSGLSTTYNSARLAAEQLAEKYPDRKITVVDSRLASGGFGLFVYQVKCKRDEGVDYDTLCAFAAKTAPITDAWFTVDDLVYLKRGGRVSAAAAFFGNALGIKPVLHMDEAGHLIPKIKVRGRKTSIISLADQYGALAVDPENGPVMICHGDCEADAKALEKLLADRYGAKVILMNYVGPVIGAHSGPGTIAMFFVGKER